MSGGREPVARPRSSAMRATLYVAINASIKVAITRLCNTPSLSVCGETMPFRRRDQGEVAEDLVLRVGTGRELGL